MTYMPWCKKCVNGQHPVDKFCLNCFIGFEQLLNINCIYLMICLIITLIKLFASIVQEIRKLVNQVLLILLYAYSTITLKLK